MAIKMKDLSYLPNHPNTGGWKDRHIAALRNVAENPIARAIAAWVQYAKAHHARFDVEIGTDGFLGPAWAAWGRALRDLLNGELGGMDGGTLVDNLTAQGFET